MNDAIHWLVKAHAGFNPTIINPSPRQKIASLSCGSVGEADAATGSFNGGLIANLGFHGDDVGQQSLLSYGQETKRARLDAGI
jgi:hypothetical protein